MKIFTCNAVTAVAVALFSIFSSINNEVNASSEIPEGMAELSCGTLDGVYFYDQVTDAPIYGPISNGDQVDLSSLTSQYYLAAHVSGGVESVTFWVDGYTSNENETPFTFPGGAHNGTNWTGGVGTHNIDVNAYSSDDAGGNHCGQLWLTFEITDNNPSSSCNETLVDFHGSCNDPDDKFIANVIGSCVASSTDLFPSNGAGTASCNDDIICLQTQYNNWEFSVTADTDLTVDKLLIDFLYPVTIGTAGGPSNDNNCPSSKAYSVKFYKNGSLVDTQIGSVVQDVIVIKTIEPSNTITLSNGDVMKVEIFGDPFSNDCSLLELAGAKVLGCCGNACDNVTSAGSIGSDGTVCAGSSYTINSVSLPSGGSGALEYVWLFNQNAPEVSGHTTINSNTASLTVSPTESGYYRRCARRAGCTDFLGESNWVFVEVNPCCTIDISASHTPNSSCDDPMTGSPTSCLCLGRMREVTFQYIGISNATINIYNNSNLDILIQSFSNVSHGDVVTTNASGFGDGRFLSKTFLELNGQITEIHTSCSQNIVGLTLDDYQILGYVDGEWNSCGVTQINNCNGSIDLNIIDGTAPYTIMWSNGSSSEDIDGLCSGDYSVSVTDANGCSFMETYSITNALGDLNISSSLNHPTVCDGTIDPPSTNCLCNGRMRKVTFKYIGASNSTVNVFDNISQNTLIQTFYNVNYGDILTANAASYSDGRFLSKTYFQSNGQFTEIHTSCSQNIVGLTLGSFEILGYVDSDWNECGSSIAENCNGSIDLTVTSGSAPYSFIWSNGDTTEDLNGLCPGTYSVIVIDANGCQMNDSFEIHCNECMSNVSTDLQPETNVTCGDALPTPTFTNGTVSSYEEYPAAQACKIELSSHASYDWRNFWFHSFPTVYDKNFVWEEGYVVVNPDNTAEIFGTVYNNTLTTSGYTVHYYFEQLVDYNTWIAGGGYNSTDTDASSRLYAQVDFTKPNSIEGFGEFANSDLELVSTGDVAFMDLGPRDVYGGYGVGFWIDYAGTVNGYPAGNTLTMTASNHNDMYASVSNCTYAPTDACTERIIREWTVVDECGVEQIFLQNVIIDNNVAPTVDSMPADVTLTCTDDLPTEEPTFSDNCGNGLMIDFNETTLAQACGLLITRTWTATSSCGLAASVTQVITISDNAAPTGTSVANVTLGCDDALPTDEPTFSDDCDNDLTITFDEVLNDLPCGHEYVRTWIATDDCGNQSSAITQTITIEDNISPIFTSVLPSDLSVDCFDDVPMPAEVIAQDNCGTVNLQYLETVPTDLCNSSLTRTWTATDECGNLIQHIQTISIMDNIAPVLSSYPANLTIECIEELPPVATVTATDNCGTPTLVFTEDPSTDGCGEGVRRIWTATDACGNETEHMQSIFVIDTTAPTGIEIADVTISTDDALPTDAPVFTDNCDTDLDITFQETTNDLPCGYEVIRTWFATDFCGNVSTTIDQIITVTDDLSPINSSTSFETLVTVSCDEPIPSDAPVFTDNFDSVLEVTFNEVTNTLACQYEIVRTWFATDDCGNVSTTVSQTITVTDTNAPTGTLVTDVSIDCEVNLPTDEPAFTDNCDNNLVVTFDEILNDLPCGSEIIRTWFAMDNCGNVSSTITQVITLTDNTAPVLDEAPADIAVECLDDVPAVASISALDNCGQASIDFLQTVANSSCNETITRTWTATDECGNTSSV
ncbi:MAG: hypothetical protein HKN39_05950, partial [Flavobacteriales bacterium]|nr:hypothetical protein [Flavobacteriales bacterium]